MTDINWRHGVLLLVCASLVALTLLHGPIPQPASYHQFADARTLWGIPNAWNVLSNLPFALVGIWGLTLLVRSPAILFRAPWERWPWLVFFLGVTLTTLGSSYYHWAPDNARLLWDRLPMTLAFMGLLAATLAERVSVRWARRLFVPLLALGIACTVYWYLTERAGHGDLAPYVFLVQGGSLLLILLMVVLFPARYGAAGFLYGGLALYAVAKVFEEADHSAFLWSLGIGGHCAKHVIAAAAVGLLACRLRRISHASDALTLNSPLKGEPR